jgi:hypothetical protein
MAESVSRVISDVLLTFPDANPSIVLDCVNRVHRDLCNEFPVYASTMTIPLVAGQRDYSIERDITAILAVAHVRGPGRHEYEMLYPVSVQDMDRLEADWRRLPDGRPNSFYVYAGKVGLVPPPKDSTVSGYPILEVEITEFVELASGDELPSCIKSRQVYVQGARRFYAEMVARDQVEFYDILYQREIQDLERVMGRRNRNFRSKMTPSSLPSVTQI